MRILLLYDNFIRDYRGLLLLAEFLEQKGNKVWIKAGWDDPFSFSELHKIEALVTGQIAEFATHKYGKYCSENNILLIINTSEPVTAENNFEILTTYNTNESNQYIIDLQAIGNYPHFNFIQSGNFIEERNKAKYKFLGYPRTDISFHKGLRELEQQQLVEKYNLNKYNKKYLFLSSFLLDGAFDGVPEQDLKRWNYAGFQQRTVELLSHTTEILKRFIDEELGDNDVLIIKKHPWDCSTYFKENFSSGKCLMLDNNEFITPCLSSADLIIHTYSTASFEAWVMGKPTVSIYLEKYLDVAPLHMKKEKIAFNYDSFIDFIEGEISIPNYNDEELFDGTMDGKATYRLAEEINRLQPKRTHAFSLSPMVAKKQFFSLRAYNNLDTGRVLHDVDNMAEKNTKYHDFLSWENQRHIVNKLYKPAIKKFVKQFLNSPIFEATY
jgi:surface carbohydrate biosynthesis protein